MNRILLFTLIPLFIVGFFTYKYFMLKLTLRLFIIRVAFIILVTIAVIAWLVYKF